MKRYWDHAESERAALTAEQVEKLLAYELMERGVLQVEPLKLQESKPVALPTRRVFCLREGDDRYGEMLAIGFDTVEQAEACRDAIRYIRETSWNGPARTRPVLALQVVTEDLPTKDTVTASETALKEAERIEQANASARSEFEKANKAVSEATSSIWTDWHDCKVTATRHQKIRDTLADYVRMTEGNEEMARSFLAKAFPADEINAALGMEPPQAVEAPRPAESKADEIAF